MTERRKRRGETLEQNPGASPGITSNDIKRLAREAGFDLCGITTPEVIPEAKQAYERWLGKNFHGELDYMASDPQRRSDPSQLMPGIRSIIMLAVNYYQPDSETIPEEHGRVSKYARGKDYHKVIEKKTKRLIRLIEDAVEGNEKPACKWFVDFGPMLERAYAQKAGLGYIGKNSMLINREFGSWLFLSEIITSLPLASDNPLGIDHGRCGKCRACMVQCPTGAIVADGVIDARKCISYLTIERPQEIPVGQRQKMGRLIFGCDICQLACPLNNRRSQISAHQEFSAEKGVGEFVDAGAVLRMATREEFLSLTAGTPLTRAKLDGLQRNAAIVLENERHAPKGRRTGRQR